ncbi:MAG: phage major tail protein, TP901-1 family [Alphaproteobacteria bacterium]
MTAQTGKALLLKVGNGDGPPETFASVAGLRAKQIQLNAQTVDVTNADTSGGWRELLAAAGVRSVSVSGNGIFKDAASDETVRGIFFNEALANWQIVIPSFGTIAGAFQITALEYAGSYDGAVTFTITLQSSGAITFTSL